MRLILSYMMCLSIFLLMACDANQETIVIFELLGESTIELGLNESYDEPGYIASIDGVIQEVIVIGEVNTTLPGTYILIYTFGETTLKREIHIIPRDVRYFNQIPPGNEPKLFAPELISTTLYSEFAGTFSPDYKYYFFTRRNYANDNRILYSTYIDGMWSEPTLSPISHDISEMEPYISFDGSSLYFSSKRDNNVMTAIYKSTYVDGSWQTAEFVDTGLNDQFSMYISMANNKNLYFTIASSEIYMMSYSNGEYQQPVATGVHGAHSFIAPDESFMLLDDSGLGQPKTSIYISKNVDGNWLEPVLLPDSINLEGYNQICPSISPDGNYLFFSRFQSGKADIYWVSIDILSSFLD